MTDILYLGHNNCFILEAALVATEFEKGREGLKTILKSSGEFYKKRSEQGIPTKPAIVVLGVEKRSDKSDKNDTE